MKLHNLNLADNDEKDDTLITSTKNEIQRALLELDMALDELDEDACSDTAASHLETTHNALFNANESIKQKGEQPCKP